MNVQGRPAWVDSPWIERNISVTLNIEEINLRDYCTAEFVKFNLAQAPKAVKVENLKCAGRQRSRLEVIQAFPARGVECNVLA